MRRMKVAVIHPLAAWSTRDVATGYAAGFEQLGHEVLRVDLWQSACRASGATEPRFYAKALTPEAHRAALKEAIGSLRSWKADWAVAVHGMDLPLDLPEDLRKRGTRSALLLTDEPYELERSLVYAKGWDLVVTNDPATLEAHRAVHPNVIYLPPGFDPAVMKPDASASASYDISFVGTWFKERVRFFEALWEEIAPRPHLLAGYWFQAGDRVPESDLPGPSPLIGKVKPVVVWPAELCRVYQRSRVSLNLHRGSLWHANPGEVAGRGVNPRLFEIAGAGGFQLVDGRDEVRACFDEHEVVSFRDAQDARGKLREWLDPAREEERRETASRALKRALAHHSYAHRATKLQERMTG